MLGGGDGSLVDAGDHVVDPAELDERAFCVDADDAGPMHRGRQALAAFGTLAGGAPLAALAAAAVPTYPDLPTGVGFCLYIRRALIQAIGIFEG